MGDEPSPDSRPRVPAALAFFVAAAGLLLAVHGVVVRAPVPLAGLPVKALGSFVAQGAVPKNTARSPAGTREDADRPGFDLPPGDRFWSSWNHHDEAGAGELVLGPFPAPAILGLQVAGFPHQAGNRLYLENTQTGAQLDLADSDVGARWCDLRIRPPASWRGQAVVLHALVPAGGGDGWMAVGAPRTVPAYAGWWDPFALRLAGFVGTGLVLLLLQSAAVAVLRPRPWIPPPFLAIGGLAAVAAVAYAAFWVFLASARAGKAVVALVLLGALVILLRAGRRPPPAPEAARDSALPLGLMAGIGLLYLGLLLQGGSSRPLYAAASHRFLDYALQIDNELPEMFADHLLRGEDPRPLAYGWWHSSERPPLQSACGLLVAYPVQAAGIDPDTAFQTAGIWLQLAWVAAAWAWLRGLGLGRRPAALAILAVACSGFLLVNTTFVWPKLLSAALALAGFGLVLLPARDPRHERPQLAAAGLLAGLGFLAHQTIAFSILGALPLALLFRRRRSGSSWLAAAAAFGAIIVPWLAYQAWYDPPSNYLLKWHLAGMQVRNALGSRDALVQAYQAVPPATLLAWRWVNLRLLFHGPWPDWVVLSTAGLTQRRVAEFHYVFFALGWWNLGFLAAAAGLAQGRREFRPIAATLAWALLTLLAWCLLMYLPGSAVIHQGSYASLLALDVALAAALWLAHRAAFFLVAGAQLLNFLAVWFPPQPSQPYALHADGLILALAGAAVTAALVAEAARAGRRPRPD